MSIPAKDPITYEDAIRLLDYRDGKLYWRPRTIDQFPRNLDPRHDAPSRCLTWNKRFAGKEAGTVHSNGYSVIRFEKRRKYWRVRAHRVVWLLHHGEWPNGEVDHINKDRLDNRIENLRVVSHAENAKNAKRRSDNTSGHTGVIWNRKLSKWQAQIHSGGKNHFLGAFTDINDAIAARKAAEPRFGFHAHHGGEA